MLAGGLGACSTRVLRAPRAEAPPVLPTAAELEGRIALERKRLQSLRTLADSEISGPDGRFRASEVVLVAPPDRLRIEVLSTFGVSWILATDGEVLDVYSRQEETVYRGRPSRSLIEYYLPVPLALADLTELLLGRPPPRAAAEADGVAWEPETGLVRFGLRLRDRGRQTTWFDGRTGLVSRCEERDAHDALVFDMRVGGYRNVGRGLVASDITIRSPDGVQVRLAYGNTELNPNLPASLFRIPFVIGARETPLEPPAR
jgi:outer membrane lipoprotein-sorting protein